MKKTEALEAQANRVHPGEHSNLVA